MPRRPRLPAPVDKPPGCGPSEMSGAVRPPEYSPPARRVAP